MKKFIFYVIIMFITIFIVTKSYSQDRVIHGRVFTFDSIPVINAQISVKSTKQIVNSDSVGRFSVACNAEDVLNVFGEGFYKQKVKLDDKTKLAIVNLKLKPGEKNREIAIGFGHVADRDLLYSVSNLNNREMDFSQYSTMNELIQGRLTGVQVVNGEVFVRGISSINSHAALIVVDGVISDNSVLSMLPPSQVKNISVIKDGGSAIYRSRGANGVVLIETKNSGEN